jgi:hypothetical protein
MKDDWLETLRCGRQVITRGVPIRNDTRVSGLGFLESAPQPGLNSKLRLENMLRLLAAKSSAYADSQILVVEVKCG